MNASIFSKSIRFKSLTFFLMLNLAGTSLAIESFNSNNSTKNTTNNTNYTLKNSESNYYFLNVSSRLKCNFHENCTKNFFTLYSYCCESTQICCSWVEHAVLYK